MAYGVSFQQLPVVRDFSQPAPASHAPAGCMEKVKTIAIADARDLAEQTALAVSIGVDVFGTADASQVGPVELDAAKQDCGDGKGRDPSARVLEVIHAHQGVVPVDRLLLASAAAEREGQDRGLLVIIALRRRGGRSRLPWPWHFVVRGGARGGERGSLPGIERGWHSW